MRLFSVTLKNEDTIYTKKVNIPQYLPVNEKPHIEELYDSKKYSSLINHINNSKVSEEEKKFLKLAASRHIMFNYAKIADYYANSSKDMQELMEESALIILDIDDAISNGYIRLSEDIQKLMQESGEKP